MSKKDNIIFTALSLYSKRGIDQVSINEIAAELGITKPAIYYYFKNKEALLEAIVEATFFKYLETLIAILSDKNLNPIDRICNVFQFAEDDFQNWGKRLSVKNVERFSFDMVTFEAIMQYPRLAKEYDKYIHRERNAAIAAIAEGIQMKQFNEGTKPADAAHGLIALLEGTYFVCADFKDANVKATFKYMLDMYVDNLTR